MRSNIYMEVLVNLVNRDKKRNTLFELTLEECEYLYSKDISVEKVNSSIYPVHYKLTLE